MTRRISFLFPTQITRSCINDEISVGVVQVTVSKSLIASAPIRALVEVQDVLTNKEKKPIILKSNLEYEKW